MKISDIVPSPSLRVQFKLLYYKQVPSVEGCYILTTFELDILYIGLSENLSIRFMQHLDNEQKTKPTKLGKATWFYYLPYSKMNLPKLERTWLNQYVTNHGELPILNKVSSPLG